MASTDLPYRPYLGGPFRWRLGLRPLDLADWIEVGADHDEQMAAKEAVLADHHDTVFAVLDGVEPESIEVLDELVLHLRRTFRPDDVARRDVVHDPTLHPLDAAGRLVQEDLVLLVEREGRLVFGGASLCFPNRWDVGSKLGRTMAEVHAPVARLNDELAEPIDRFLERLTPERSFWRLGWGVLDTDDLYQPVDGTAAPRPGAASVDHLTIDDVFVRVERETLRRFAQTNCVLFTIRTYVSNLATVAADPVESARLADAIGAMPGDVAEYKQLDRLGPRVVEWLRGAGRTR